MPRAVLEPRVSRKASQNLNAPSCDKTLSGHDSCPVGDAKKFPDIQSMSMMRDPLIEPSSKVYASLSKNPESVSAYRIDAGEPYASTYSVYSASAENCREACENLKRFQKLGASSSEQLQNALLVPESQNFSERSSTRSKLINNLMDLGKEEKIEESNALKRWEYWLEDKKKVQNYLSKQLDRPVSELLMQESDKFREVMEKKMIGWYSRLPEQEKWKGILARWRPQMRIRNKKNVAQYCLIKSKLENGEGPDMEFIGVPDTIKKEKGLLGDGSNKRTKSDYERKVHCKEERNCDTHEIDMSELAVVGVKIPDSTLQSQYSFTTKNYPEIVEDGPVDEEPSECMGRKSVFSLVIGNEEIKYEMESGSPQDPDRMLVWNVDFGVNTAGSTSEKMLRVENRGTVAVRYDWLPAKKEKKSSFSGLPSKHSEPWFFFNKNSGYFLPGQIYYLKFYFQGRTSGVRKETWHMRTNPPLSDKERFATIVLSGVATEEYSTEIRDLEFYLEKRVMESCILGVIEEIMYKVLDPCNGLEDIEYRSIFTDKQLFEYQNPNHFYHSSIVKELKRIFKEIPEKTEREWNLSLNSLWNIIKAHKTGKEQSNSLKEVAEMSKALYRPNHLPARDTASYRMSYGVLCEMANLIEGDYNLLRDLVSEKVEEPPRWKDFGEARESTVSMNTAPEEMGETESKEMLQIRPISFMFFRTFVYVKTYRRLCDATERIAGILETRKIFKPWKSVNYKPPKPPRVGKEYLLSNLNLLMCYKDVYYHINVSLFSTSFHWVKTKVCRFYVTIWNDGYFVSQVKFQLFMLNRGFVGLHRK